jgi:hypothetical protein
LSIGVNLSVRTVLDKGTHKPGMRAQPGKKTTHRVIKAMYNQFGEMGNVFEEFTELFEELSSLRSRVRYFDPTRKLPEEDCKQLLQTVDLMIQDSGKRIARSGIFSE